MNPSDLLTIGLEAAIAAQMVLLSVFLVLGQQKKSQSLWLLAALTATFGVQMILNAAVGNGYWPWAHEVRPVLALYLGPLLLLYVCASRQNARPLRSVDALHAIPALFGIVLLLHWIELSLDAYIIAVLAAYAIASAGMLARDRKRFVPPLLFVFLITLVGFFSVLVVLDGVIALQDDPQFRQRSAYMPALILLLVFSSGLLFTALRNTHLLILPSSTIKYAGTAMGRSETEKLRERLDTIMDSEKLYCDADLNLAVLAERLGTRARFLSQLINTAYGLNFSAYINRLRIEEAGARLTDPARADTQVTAILYEVGFGSKSAFNREFRRHFGRGPSEHRRNGSQSGSAD